jgi:hypothetical protein
VTTSGGAQGASAVVASLGNAAAALNDQYASGLAEMGGCRHKDGRLRVGRQPRAPSPIPRLVHFLDRRSWAECPSSLNPQSERITKIF